MLNLQYPNGTYSVSNPPSNETLKGDLADIQTAVNANESAIALVYTASEIDALLLSVKQALYPVGSYYANGAVSTNPATLLGFGTWVAVAGKGIMGYNASETEFDTLLKTGGEKTHLLTGAESGEKGHTHSDSGHGHSYPSQDNSGSSLARRGAAGSNGTLYVDTGYANIQAVAASDASSAHNNLQPYEVAALWRRTA